MNKSKITDYDYIDFLIGTQRVYSCTEAERVQPDESCSPSHDAFTRQLNRLLPGTERLWSEVREHVDLRKGCLICDDSTLDKLCQPKNRTCDPSLVWQAPTGCVRHKSDHAALDGRRASSPC